MTAMSINDINGGAALIGISMGTMNGAAEGESGPNVHVVLKASSRQRAIQVMRETLQELEASSATARAGDPVFLHFSTYDLMRS
jgi:hypothetical protein